RAGTRERPQLPEGKQRHDGQAGSRSSQSAEDDSGRSGGSGCDCRAGASYRYAGTGYDDAVGGGSGKGSGATVAVLTQGRTHSSAHVRWKLLIDGETGASPIQSEVAGRGRPALHRPRIAI